VWCKSCDAFTSDAGPAESGVCAECFARDTRLLFPKMKRGRVWRSAAKAHRGRRKGDYEYEFEGTVGCLNVSEKVWPNKEEWYAPHYYLKNRSCWVDWPWNEGEKPVLRTYAVGWEDVEVPFWEPLSRKDEFRYWCGGCHLGREAGDKGFW